MMRLPRPKMFWLAAVLAAAVAMSFACNDGNPTSPPPPSGQQVQSLTQRSHVLNNFELAYNQRRVDMYNGILDANFTFFLSPGDVGGGLPESWNRADEIDVNTKLFNKSYAALPCQSIYVNLETDSVQWTGYTPTSAPTETWYKATLHYNFKFEIAPRFYISLPGASAEFAVRNAGTDSAPRWQLVEMRDLGGFVNALDRTSGTKESSWGQVKALYRDAPQAEDLTQKEHVLDNIELAYNERQIEWYKGVLDANFTFFLSVGDVGGGLPESWDRATEVDVNTKLLDKNYVPFPAQSISLDIRTENGLTWTEFSPPAAPTETWYTVTLPYDFRIEIAPNTYIPAPGSMAQFTVRDAGSSYPDWRLVEMRDLGGSFSALQLASSTRATTWGQVKALYR
jgi:hypothetical protein